MLITTRNDVPGHTIEEVLGEVLGPTVRSRHMRFDTPEVGANRTEICAYGTAVRVRKA